MTQVNSVERRVMLYALNKTLSELKHDEEMYPEDVEYSEFLKLRIAEVQQLIKLANTSNCIWLT